MKRIRPNIVILVWLIFSALTYAENQQVEKWNCFEVTLKGPSIGNPFKEVTLSAIFTYNTQRIKMHGFYDGKGIYKIRFMPNETGEWSYETHSNQKELNHQKGSFQCIRPSNRNHGPVHVMNTWHFAYSDLTPYRPFGTTAYNWVHQSESLQKQTLKTLARSPFNKVRMCVLPKYFMYTKDEPHTHPFECDSEGFNDYTRFNPAFFQKVEKRIVDLMHLGIEADVILFHPYDKWGYAKMEDDVDDLYLEYVIRRFASYRNVWWSLANEYDLLDTKTMDDWDRFFRIVVENDPFDHLRGIHHLTTMYDHTKAWVTHASIQSSDFMFMEDWRNQFKKPIVIDECRYEGNVDAFWGDLSGQEMTRRFWIGTLAGCYIGHGETYLHPQDILWWSKGGVLHGESPERIAFLRHLVEASPVEGLEPLTEWSCGKEGEYYLYYFGKDTLSQWTFQLPPYRKYQVDIIDTWNMSIHTLEKTYGEVFTLDLPDKPFMAVRIQKVGYDFIPEPVKIDYYGNLFLNTAKVQLAHNENHTIYYTEDGSIPTTKSTQYKQPIIIKKDSLTLRAFSVGSEGEVSRIVSRIFYKTEMLPAIEIDNPKSKLNYTYYKGKWEELPEFEALKPIKKGQTETFNILLRNQDDFYGLVFDGYILIPEDNVYTFITRSDDGSRILIDGQCVVDNDGLHAMLRQEGSIVLEKGYHKIQLQFFEGQVGEGLEVFWASPNMQECLIPTQVLFH